MPNRKKRTTQQINMICYKTVLFIIIKKLKKKPLYLLVVIQTNSMEIDYTDKYGAKPTIGE